ncbi:MAG TPA: histidine kinase, partial [Acidovorax sp.]
MLAVAPPPPAERLHRIALARSALLNQEQPSALQAIEPWIVRSWQRCLASGHRPAQPLAFNIVSAPTVQRTADQHATLLRA